MTAMEPPISFDADAVRAKKAEVIEAIRPLDSAAGVEGRGARPVRRRHRLGQAGPGLSPGARRGPGFDDRDLHRLQAA